MKFFLIGCVKWTKRETNSDHEMEKKIMTPPPDLHKWNSRVALQGWNPLISGRCSQPSKAQREDSETQTCQTVWWLQSCRCPLGPWELGNSLTAGRAVKSAMLATNLEIFLKIKYISYYLFMLWIPICLHAQPSIHAALIFSLVLFVYMFFFFWCYNSIKEFG